MMTRRMLIGARAALVSVTAAVLVAGSSPAATATPLGGDLGSAPIDSWLVERLTAAAPDETLTVLVHGTSLRAAHAAADRAGLTRLHDLERIGVSIASGTPGQVHLAARQPGVAYVEGNRPLEYFLDTSHEATRGAEAAATLAGADGGALDGTGVSVAVIDTGVDPTHPFFREADGSSAVVANLKNMCLLVTSDLDTCFVDAGQLVDTDTISAGGHGTHVNGIVAGRPTTLADGTELFGAAPGAKLVSLAVGAGVSIINATLAFEWVLEHHDAPCGDGVPVDVCPPIKVTNNSWGSRGEFDPNSAIATLQRELAAEGVVTVWANGNSGGDGTTNTTNPPGGDPTPGILAVASYFDQNTGTRDGALSSFSSRGDRARSETWPDISAPGESITSSCRPYLWICSTGGDFRNGPGPADVGSFNTISGTSMAAPHIAGIVAQLFQAKPDATPAEIEHALKASAYKYSDGAAYETVGDYTSSYDKGTGLADVIAAVQELRASSVANGSFEITSDGLLPDGWAAHGDTGYDTSGERASHGEAAVGITGDGSTAPGRWTSDAVAVSAGQSYAVSAVVTSAPATAAPSVTVEFLDSAGGVVDTAVVADPSEAGELLGAVTVPTRAQRARIVLRGFGDGSSTTGTVWFDDVWLG